MSLLVIPDNVCCTTRSVTRGRSPPEKMCWA